MFELEFCDIEGNLSRIEGPALIDSVGNKWWYQNDLLHRLNGPAVEWANGGKEWYQNDKLHRLDGPARCNARNYKEWWVNGKKYTEKDFLKYSNVVVHLKK